MTILEMLPFFAFAGAVIYGWLQTKKADKAILEVEQYKLKATHESRRANVMRGLLDEAELSRKEMHDAINKDVEEARHTRQYFSK